MVIWDGTVSWFFCDGIWAYLECLDGKNGGKERGGIWKDEIPYLDYKMGGIWKDEIPYLDYKMGGKGFGGKERGGIWKDEIPYLDYEMGGKGFGGKGLRRI